MTNKFILLIILFFSPILLAATQPAITQTIPVTELKGFEQNSSSVKTLLNSALALADQKLTYQYGSANPKNGGMDCSGTIYYLLQANHIDDVPRQANEIYLWAAQKGKFYPVTHPDFNSPEFNNLKAGDLLFWTGTYAVKRVPPITHVMIYLGKNERNEPLMIGASDGRSYQGKKMWGVSVFDFKLPPRNSTSQFIGYSCIPTLTCELQSS